MAWKGKNNMTKINLEQVFVKIGTEDITKLNNWESFARNFKDGEEEKEDRKLND